MSSLNRAPFGEPPYKVLLDSYIFDFRMLAARMLW